MATAQPAILLTSEHGQQPWPSSRESPQRVVEILVEYTNSKRSSWRVLALGSMPIPRLFRGLPGLLKSLFSGKPHSQSNSVSGES